MIVGKPDMLLDGIHSAVRKLRCKDAVEVAGA
jgi:hypothetical protein